jgi:hypothetical protein
MDAQDATRTLEVIRTLMERTCQYQFLTARAGLAAGTLAACGALSFNFLDATDPRHFGVVWALVFVGSLLATVLSTVFRVRELGERVWSRQTRAVVLALAPSVFAALVLTIFLFWHGLHLWLPGVWMLCYGQGALATSVYAPAPIRRLGIAVLALSGLAFLLGPDAAVWMMGLVFGLGHVWLGVTLLIAERRQQSALRLHRTVA